MKQSILLECVGCGQRYSLQELKMLPKIEFNQIEYKGQCYCNSETFKIIIVNVV